LEVNFIDEKKNMINQRKSRS